MKMIKPLSLLVVLIVSTATAQIEWVDTNTVHVVSGKTITGDPWPTAFTKLNMNIEYLREYCVSNDLMSSNMNVILLDISNNIVTVSNTAWSALVQTNAFHGFTNWFLDDYAGVKTDQLDWETYSVTASNKLDGDIKAATNWVGSYTPPLSGVAYPDQANGWLGILTTPAHTLDVNGDINATSGAAFASAHAGISSGGHYWQLDDTDSTIYYLHLNNGVPTWTSSD